MYFTREIPREGWSDYLTLLSNIERDHWVRIEMEDPDHDGHLMASRLPLIDISMEEKGSGAGTIEVTVGRPGEEITHRIFHPDHLYAGESESGELECLGIEDSEHMKTHIYFEPMMPMDECVAPM